MMKIESLCIQHVNYLIKVCAIFYIDYVMTLELIELRVPTYLPLGISGVLFCRWSLGPHEVLYSVKWYKDGKEFFRYVPKDEEPFRKYLLPGVDVEVFSSSGSNLTLVPAVLETSGRYRCEVSGERPQFQTVSEYADMHVVVPPSHGPSIHGFESLYRVGDHVAVNCSSGQTQSAVRLTWYINGDPAIPTVVPRPTYVEDNRVTTSLGIEFTLTDNLIGNLKLQCVATIASTYWQSVEKRAIVFEAHRYVKSTHIVKDKKVLACPTNAKSRVKIIKQQYSVIVVLFFCVIYM